MEITRTDNFSVQNVRFRLYLDTLSSDTLFLVTEAILPIKRYSDAPVESKERIVKIRVNKIYKDKPSADEIILSLNSKLLRDGKNKTVLSLEKCRGSLADSIKQFYEGQQS